MNRQRSREHSVNSPINLLITSSIALMIPTLLSLSAFAQPDATPAAPAASTTTQAPAPTAPSATTTAPGSAAVEPAASAAPSEKVEKVEVTGSHIKRIDSEGVSPVTTITRKELEKSGYNSVSDVLRDTTLNSFGSAREASGGNAAGVAEVDLRGLGSSNTLVLLNGQRLPTDAVTGAVDLNLIPMAAVERIEVLKDGASAIYGSDALGGVVNIITRKDFKGNEIAITQTVPQMNGGRKTELSLTNGINRERFNMVNVVQYRNNGVIYSRDRSWSNTQSSTYGSPGSYRNSGQTWNADPKCPAGMIADAGSSGKFCTFNPADYSTTLPALEQYNLLSESNYELNSNVKLTARLGGTEKKVKWSYAPAPGTFTIPGSTADTLGAGTSALPNTTAGQDLSVRYRLMELGTRDTEVTTKSYNVLLGSSVQVGGSWQIDTTLSHNMVYNHDEGVNGYALTTGITDAISNGQFNPFASSGSRGSLDSARYNPVEETTSQLSSADIKGTGEIGELAGGPIGLAVGTTFTFQRYDDDFDQKSVNDEVFGNAGSSGSGQRDTRAVYAEFSFPIFKPLELQLAARYDHYSDFGDTTNPKIALLYHVNKDLLFRGSYGTGFKAPLMQDMYAATSNGNPTFIDQVACNKEKSSGVAANPSACSPQQWNVTSSGNPGLKQETSESYTLGTVFEPTNDFNVSLDFFKTILKNVVGIDYGDLTKAEANGTDLTPYHITVDRDSTGAINSITAPLQNLSAQEIAGFDLATAYRIHRVKLSMDHSQLFYFKEEGFPGAGLTDKLGDHGKPAWRNTVAVDYTITDGQDLTLIAMTIPGQTMSVTEDGKTSNYTQYDLSYGLKTKSWGTFSAGIKNLLGTTPPLDTSNPNEQLDETLYDQIGRQFIAGYKTTF